jgi:hypothetical protein
VLQALKQYVYALQLSYLEGEVLAVDSGPSQAKACIPGSLFHQLGDMRRTLIRGLNFLPTGADPIGQRLKSTSPIIFAELLTWQRVDVEGRTLLGTLCQSQGNSALGLVSVAYHRAAGKGSREYRLCNRR